MAHRVLFPFAMRRRGWRPGLACLRAALFCFCLPAAGADAAPVSFADRLAACAFRHPVTTIKRLADLPPAIRAALAERGAMAEAGGNFNATDVISLKDPVPRTRFMRAGQWQKLVYVWYEAGGIALFHRLAVYRLKDDGSAQPITDLMDDGHDPCALTDAALDADGKP